MSPPLLILIWAFFFYVLTFEILALIFKEKKWPTWSRIIWAIHRKWPWFRFVTLAIIFIIALWAAIHLGVGECAFGMC